MKLIATLLFPSIVLAQLAATAQPPAKAGAATHAAPHAAAAAHACSKLPELSPKIPALPPGTPCARPLYTITTTPPVKLTEVSPMEPADLGDSLGISLPATITLSYIDTKVGAGALAAPHKWYSMKYHGYLADGTEFDASDKHPEMGPTFNFQQGPQAPQGHRQVIVGWDTGLDGMRVGGKRRLFIPYELAYGPNGNPQAKIPPKAWLVFDIEFVAQSDTDPSPKPPAPPATSAAPNPGGAPPAAAPATAPTAPAPKPQ